MTTVVGIVFLAGGILMLIFASRIARSRLTAHFSQEEIAGSSQPSHRRVRLAIAGVTIANVAFGLLAICAGIRLLF
jgi:uncharacterized membrane protein HdeD (DUF308 family)